MESIYKCNQNAKLEAWVKRPSGLIKLEGSTNALKRSYLVKGRQCGKE